MSWSIRIGRWDEVILQKNAAHATHNNFPTYLPILVAGLLEAHLRVLPAPPPPGADCLPAPAGRAQGGPGPPHPAGPGRQGPGGQLPP